MPKEKEALYAAASEQGGRVELGRGKGSQQPPIKLF